MKIKYIFGLFFGFFGVVFGQKPKPEILFDGTSFKNWHIYNHPNTPVNDKWKIENEAMVFVNQGLSNYATNDLISDKEYEDFVLELEWKIEKGGNSGIFFSVVEDPSLEAPYYSGPEIQVLDDENHYDAHEGINGNRRAGSLYDMIPSASKALTFDHWNKIKIKKYKNKITVWQNGKLAVKFDCSGPNWDKMVANSKFKEWQAFGKSSKGHIGLQDHGAQVSFKNIKITSL